VKAEIASKIKKTIPEQEIVEPSPAPTEKQAADKTKIVLPFIFKN
jgi:hypothetical protein